MADILKVSNNYIRWLCPICDTKHNTLTIEQIYHKYIKSLTNYATHEKRRIFIDNVRNECTDEDIQKYDDLNNYTLRYASADRENNALEKITRIAEAEAIDEK